MKRHFILAAVAGLLLITVAGCGGEEEPSNTNTTPAGNTGSTTGGATGGGGSGGQRSAVKVDITIGADGVNGAQDKTAKVGDSVSITLKNQAPGTVSLVLKNPAGNTVGQGQASGGGTARVSSSLNTAGDWTMTISGGAAGNGVSKTIKVS